MAEQEVERYTFRAPGAGDVVLLWLHAATRSADRGRTKRDEERSKFNARDFHDFILAQGLLPPELLKEAVAAQFVKPIVSSGRGSSTPAADR